MSQNKCFIDSNILIYATNPISHWHRLANNRMFELEELSYSFVISTQVIREYLVFFTRVLAEDRTFTQDLILANVDDFITKFTIIEDSLQITNRLVSILRDFRVGGKQIHDANIVATMLVHDIKHLLTHNVQDFARFADLITIMPLESE